MLQELPGGLCVSVILSGTHRGADNPVHVAAEGGKAKTRVIDLDVDIGADAVDYK